MKSSKATTQEIFAQGANKKGSGIIIYLESKDKRIVEISKEIALTSQLLADMLENISESETTNSQEQPIPIPFEQRTLARVIQFMDYELYTMKMPEIEKPVPTDRLEDCVPHWFAKFINLQNLEEIYDLIAAANYMIVNNLVELGCAKVGSLMKSKTIPELRSMFHIVNDFTPEEERSIQEGKADIWGDEDDEGDENEEVVLQQQNDRSKITNREEQKVPK